MSLVSLLSLLSPVPLVPLPCPVLLAGSWGLAAVGNAQGAAGPVPTVATSPICSHLCQMGRGQSAGGWGGIVGCRGLLSYCSHRDVSMAGPQTLSDCCVFSQ